MPVYMIHAEGTPLYKIGFSEDPEKRIKRLQTGSPHELVLLGTVAQPSEAWWHCVFQRRHKWGEWFALSERDKALFWSIEGAEYYAERPYPRIMHENMG